MAFLPLYFDLKNQQVLIVGGGEKAARKAELLLRAGVRVNLVGRDLVASLSDLVDSGQVNLLGDAYSPGLMSGQSLVVAASESSLDEVVAADARQAGLHVNVVNNAALSSFIFPSIVNRSPVIAAVSSSARLPVFTRMLRSKLEAFIPDGYGRLVEVASRLKQEVNDRFPELTARRKFWERVLEGRFAELVYSGNETEAESVLSDHLHHAQTGSVGEVYLVGAGPGDPDLLTLKALRLIGLADVVVYDRLVSKPVLAKTRRDAEKIHVGKRRNDHTLPQGSINQLLVDLARQGKRVLRLKGGDPFIFGRGGEEIAELSKSGIPFQVVPGITAASGCASYAGIPLTHRDYSQSVRFITGHLKNDTCDLPWNELVCTRQTLVFYMGLLGLPTISRELVRHGMSDSTPVALIARGTTPDQLVLIGTLGNIVAKIAEQDKAGNPVKTPALIIIGEVVALRDRLRWFD
ncbi:MAG: uroporphyrinogen-III C-methyltransferase [Proteobacteria bacterium]|nr:MAG: uroporphyrinogen-III C-methyltransferase [Pseudomonadota bacterium]PIE37078.1 MAG: uroporphyrinogen-III C-methyltransferase [Gammaproteobacteria bacterium]